MIRKILLTVEILFLSLVVLGGSRLSQNVSGNNQQMNVSDGTEITADAGELIGSEIVEGSGETDTLVISDGLEKSDTSDITDGKSDADAAGSGQESSFNWNDYQTIAHALGGMDGDTYLNSKESFLNAYQKGIRLFEVDLTQTSDGVWVCRHSWNTSLGQWEGDGKQVLSLEEFLAAPIYGKYTPMTLQDLFILLKDYPDAYAMLDSKAYSIRNYRRTLEDYSDYVDLANGAGAPEALKQIIPEIYNEAMFSGTALMHQFPTYIYSLWKKYSGEELREIAAFCKEKRIPAATVSETYWTEQTQEIFDEQGILVYIYTVNDVEKAEKYKQKGVAGICTDSLFEEE